MFSSDAFKEIVDGSELMFTRVFFYSLRSSVSICLVFHRVLPGIWLLVCLARNSCLDSSLPGIHVCTLKSSGALLLPFFHRGESVYQGATSMHSIHVLLSFLTRRSTPLPALGILPLACAFCRSGRLLWLVACIMRVCWLDPCTFSIVHESFLHFLSSSLSLRVLLY